MRPREFDQNHVLQVAFDAFWRKGVRATSLSDIARDAGVQRGSLYNAFGSKEALFLSAYELYAAEYLKSIRKALASGPLHERLKVFFELTIRRFRSGSPPRGCPTTRGLMELTIADQDVQQDARKAFANLLNTIAALLHETFADAASRGQFTGDASAAALHVLTVTRGLAVLERAFGDEAQLKKIAAHTVALLLGGNTGGKRK